MGTGTELGRGARPGGGLARAAIAAALLLAGAPAQATHPLVSDDAGTLGHGSRQLELNGGWTRDHAAAPGAAVHEEARELVAAFAVGLHDRADLVLSVPTTWTAVREGEAAAVEEVGPGDLGVELKWRAYERGGFALAVKPGVTLPTGDARRGLGSGAVGYGAALIASWELGPASLHLNGGWSRQRFALEADRAAHRPHAFHASVALVAAARERLRVVANLGVETNPVRGEPGAPAFALAGAVWAITDRLDLDLGVKAGLTEPEADLALLAGLASRF